MAAVRRPMNVPIERIDNGSTPAHGPRLTTL